MAINKTDVSQLLPEIEEELLNLAAEGKTMKQIRLHVGFSASKFAKYKIQHPIFADALARAREHGAEELLDELVSIADTEPDPNVARVKIDARKWHLSRGFPTKYGDRIDVNMNQTVNMRGVLDASYLKAGILPNPPQDEIDVTPTKIDDIL